MKRRTVLSTLLSASALTTWATSAAAAAPALGDVVAWPSVGLLDGGQWSAEKARGRAVVVVFWSLTCPFCARHNVHVEKLRQAALGKPLTVLGVVRDRDPQAVRQHMKQHDWQFPVTLETAAMSAALSARRVVPLTVTVDRQGRLREVIPGEMFEEDVLDLLKLAL